MVKFQRAFIKTLITEADDDPSDLGKVADSLGSDEAVFKASLEKGTPADTFDVQGLGDNGGQSSYIETAKNWIHKLDKFADELNGLDSSSLNSQLNEIDREGSIFRGVVNDQSDNIVKVTEILKSMGEGLKGYIIGAKRKQREQEAQRSSSSNI